MNLELDVQHIPLSDDEDIRKSFDGEDIRNIRSEEHTSELQSQR